MALPGDLETVLVTGTFLGPSGVVLSGSVTFTPSTTLADATGKVIIQPVSRTYWLLNGSFETDPLVSTDSATISPGGWAYVVLVAIADADPYSFSVLIPHTTSPVDLSALVPVATQGLTGGGSYISAAGGAMTGTLDLSGTPPLQIAAGATAGAVLTSDGAGNAAWSPGPLSAKDSVQVATAAALPSNTYASGALTAAANGALTVDGIAVTAGMRVLVQDEATAANNGIYTVTQAGGASTRYILTRASDMSAGTEVPGAFAYAEEGTANAGAGFIVQGAGPFTIGTTAITWAQFSGAGSITAGTGLAKSGSTLSLITPVTLSDGGTGQVSAQAAMNALAGGVTTGQYLRGNGTNVALSAIQAGDVPTLNQSTTGNAATATSAANVSGTVAIANGGTSAVTAAAALAALGAVPLAGGTMTGALTLPNNPAAALQAAPKQYVDAAQAAATVLDWINVKASPYNATGNGTTDDTTAIQAAITAARSAGSGVYFPVGTYLISSPLLVGGGSPGAIRLAADGWNTQVKLANAANCYMFDFGSGGSPQYTPGLRMENLYLNCNGANQTTAGGGVYARGAVWCEFDHVWFEAPWEAGIRFYQDGTGSNGHHNTMRDCLFRDGKLSDGGQGYAILFQAADENTCTGCTFQDNGVYLGAGHDAQVYDTSAGLQSFTACHFVGGGTSVPMFFSNSSPGRCTFSTCQFDSPNGADCVILNGSGHSFVGNNFLGVGNAATSKAGGVHIGGTSGIVVQGNTFYSASATYAVAVYEDSGAGPNFLDLNTASGTWGSGPWQTTSGGGTVIAPPAAAGGNNISQGSGAPSAPNGNAPAAGDIWFRTDTPGTANQRIYICTAGGGTPTWSGIV